MSKLATLSRIAMVAANLASIPYAHATGQYDGQWTVRVQSQGGGCPNSASLTLGVAASRISGGMIVSTSGSVDAQGHVSLAISFAGDRIAARGALNQQTGAGSWSSPTRGCAGSWTATRI